MNAHESTTAATSQPRPHKYWRWHETPAEMAECAVETPAPAGELDYREREELERCEAIVAGGLETFIAVGYALLVIRDQRLYRATHNGFESYLRERWSMHRSRAYQLIDAAGVAGNLSTIVDTPQPTHESQVRSLAGLEPEEQRSAWTQAVAESHGHTPTAAKVKAVTDRKKRKRERRRRQRERRQNAVWNVKLSLFIHAIETLAYPHLPLAELAAALAHKNTPNKDWPGQAAAALENLRKFVQEISATVTRPQS